MTQQDVDRYAAAMHAVQSGVAMEIDAAVEGHGTTPKHLRVGINSALIGQAALAGLLIERGLFTIDDYEAALATEAELEQTRYEQRLSDEFGTTVTLS